MTFTSSETDALRTLKMLFELVDKEGPFLEEEPRNKFERLVSSLTKTQRLWMVHYLIVTIQNFLEYADKEERDIILDQILEFPFELEDEDK